MATALANGGREPGMLDGLASVTVGTFQLTSPMSSEPPP